MSYRITAEDGLRINGTRVNQKGQKITDEYYDSLAVANGWADKVEKIEDPKPAKQKSDK